MKKLWILLLIVLGGSAALYSCRYDPDSFLQPQGDFDGQLLLPFVFGDFTLGSLIDTNNIELKNDGSYRFEQEKSTELENLVTVPGVQQTVGYTDTFDLGGDFYNNFLPNSGNVEVESIRLIIGVENNTGNALDFESLEIGSINGVDPNAPRTTFTTNQTLRVPPNATREFEYDQDNSNIGDVVTNYPEKIFFDTEVKATGGNRFSANEDIRTFARLIIDPIAIDFDQVLLRDTLDVVLDATGEGEGVFGNQDEESSTAQLDTGSMVLRANSTFPTDLNLRLYLLDEQLQVIDSLHDDAQGFGVAAYTDIRTNPENADSVRTLRRIALTEERAENVTNASFVRVDAEVNTPGTDFAIIYAQSKLDLKLIIDAGYNLKVR